MKVESSSEAFNDRYQRIMSIRSERKPPKPPEPTSSSPDPDMMKGNVGFFHPHDSNSSVTTSGDITSFSDLFEQPLKDIEEAKAKYRAMGHPQIWMEDDPRNRRHRNMTREEKQRRWEDQKREQNRLKAPGKSLYSEEESGSEIDAEEKEKYKLERQGGLPGPGQETVGPKPKPKDKPPVHPLLMSQQQFEKHTPPPVPPPPPPSSGVPKDADPLFQKPIGVYTDPVTGKSMNYEEYFQHDRPYAQQAGFANPPPGYDPMKEDLEPYDPSKDTRTAEQRLDDRVKQKRDKYAWS